MRSFSSIAALGVTLIQSTAYAQLVPPQPTPANTSTTQSTSSLAGAESPSAASPRSTGECAPREDDLVILRDGSRYRGLIVESIPDDHISIAIAEGTLRQLPFEEVVYAGPSKTAPASPVVATRTASRDERPHTETKRRSPKPGESMVHFRTRTPELTVWVAEVSNGPNGPTDSGFRRLCEAPCSEPLEHGLYRLAYSRADSRPLEVKSNININREAAVEADISSRRGTRVAGWVILGLGAATGTVLLSLTFDPLKGRRDGYIVGGVAALALGPTLGLPLALTSDTAIVAEVGLPRSTPNTPNAGDTGTYNGLAWTGRF